MQLKEALSWLTGTLQRNLIPLLEEVLGASVNRERAAISQQISGIWI